MYLTHDEVSCRVCEKKADVPLLRADGREWLSLPNGWFVTDTYPPGDMGIQVVCSVECGSKLGP